MRSHQHKSTSRPPSAFSLVEVVMALGIVTFALVTVIGLFGGVITRAGDNTERRSLIEAVDALRGHLLLAGFDQAYTWAVSTNELVYVTFKAADDGTPAANGGRTLGRWLGINDPALDDYEAARTGRWIKARLRVSPSNPAGTNAPEAPSDYPAAMLAILAQMEAVASPAVPLPETPRMETTIGITR